MLPEAWSSGWNWIAPRGTSASCITCATRNFRVGYSVVSIAYIGGALKGGIGMATKITTTSAATSREQTPARTILRDHPVEVALFNSTGFITFVWLAVRVWLGVQWIRFG